MGHGVRLVALPAGLWGLQPPGAQRPGSACFRAVHVTCCAPYPVVTRERWLNYTRALFASVRSFP